MWWPEKIITLKLQTMKKLTSNFWFLSLACGVLLWLAWPPFLTTPLIFIGFLPLFKMQRIVQEEGQKTRVFWFYTFIAMLVWNILTTWWVYYASPAAIAAWLLNALLMSLPWLFFHYTRKTFGDKLAFPALICYWLAFEYLHLNWQVAWPWLTLGNVFASAPNMVQWYEYTGFLGGTVWVLLINILVFKLISNYTKSRAIGLSICILLPLIASYYILNTFYTHDKVGEESRVNTSVVQPNIDPYTDKFGGMTPEEQLQVMMKLAKQSIKPGATRLVVFPETSLTQTMYEDQLNEYQAIQTIREFCKKYNVSVLTGADTRYNFKPGEKLSPTARKYQDADIYFDAYNTALLIDATDSIQIYHKCKLVPGVEILPYPQIFKPIEKMFDLGGTSGSLGNQGDVSVFEAPGNLKMAPIICYESVFGDWVTKYVREGANLLVIITNDGWWRNTPGYRQHLQYARLRAIEVRRNIVRSANTGVSAFIDYKGEVLEETEWWVPAQLNRTVGYRNGLTWYAQTGDYIGKIGAWLGVLIALSTLVKMRVKKGY